MTILYRKSDLSHANAWVLNNVSNRGRCKDILSGFADSWKYINAHLAGERFSLECSMKKSVVPSLLEAVVMYVKPKLKISMYLKTTEKN